MKKKLLAGILSVLMILTMATGALGSLVIVNPNTNNNNNKNDICQVPTFIPSDINFSKVMIDECPECDANAFFYIVRDGVRYYCTCCKATGYAYKPTYDCDCGWNCTCIIKCSCGRFVYCGQPCKICNLESYCFGNCNGCQKPTDPKPTDPKPEDRPTTPPADDNAEHKVTVTQSIGGTHELTGGLYGKKDEVNTLKIYVEKGYELRNVIINGISYGNKFYAFELKMDRDYKVQIVFRKVNTYGQYIVSATGTDGGSILLNKNDTPASSATVKASYNDVLTYYFIPKANHVVKDVIVNGKSIGAQKSYTVKNIKSNITISVVFSWDTPYSDVTSDHAAAVEYVTTNNLMGSFFTYINKDLFMGNEVVNLRSVACILAEMADTADKLDTPTERVQWCIDNGVISKDTDIKKTATAKTLCDIVAKVIEIMEKENKISFIGNKDGYTAKETCFALELISKKAYATNAKITRYDFAELCYALSNLEYTK